MSTQGLTGTGMFQSNGQTSQRTGNTTFTSVTREAKSAITSRLPMTTDQSCITEDICKVSPFGNLLTELNCLLKFGNHAGKEAIVPKKQSAQIGQRQKMSAMDIKGIQEYYGCKSNKRRPFEW